MIKVKIKTTVATDTMGNKYLIHGSHLSYAQAEKELGLEPGEIVSVERHISTRCMKEQIFYEHSVDFVEEE